MKKNRDIVPFFITLMIPAVVFRCTDAKNGNIILHYYSEREGLEPIVIGLVKTVAQRLHNTQVDVSVIQEKKPPLSGKKDKTSTFRHPNC